MNSQQRFQDAIPHFQRVTELDPKLSMARIQLAQAYAKTKQWQAAEAQFREVATSEPRMAATAYHGLGAALVAQQRWSEAVTAFDEAIGAGGRTPSVLTSLGLAHWKSGDTAKARKAFEDAMTIAPNFPPAKRGLAMLAEEE